MSDPQRRAEIVVRLMRHDDFAALTALTRRVYPEAVPWTAGQLDSHLRIFPEGQFVAEAEGAIVGMASSLIVLWDDYDIDTGWRDFTDNGMFTNHDPFRGRTLYGAEVMVDPAWQGRGVGSALYEARRALVTRLGLARIRAGARLRGYHQFADRMSAEEYVAGVVAGTYFDPTLSFQLKRGFRVLAVASGYLRNDPESLGYAAVIEWPNPAVAAPPDRT